VQALAAERSAVEVATKVLLSPEAVWPEVVLPVKTRACEAMGTVERRKKVAMTSAAKAAAMKISVLAVWAGELVGWGGLVVVIFFSSDELQFAMVFPQSFYRRWRCRGGSLCRRW
jgi:hypothetical protein